MAIITEEFLGSINTGVLQIANGVALDSTLQTVTDQSGTSSLLKLSTTKVVVIGDSAFSIYNTANTFNTTFSASSIAQNSVLTLPNIAAGTLATTNNDNNFSVAQTFTNSITLSATNSNGFLGLRAQATGTIATPSSGINIYANSTGLFSWKNSAGWNRSFGNPSATADLSFTLPNSSGTLALIDVSQTFTASQTIQSSLILSATNSNSYLGLRSQATGTVATPSTGVNVFANASGQFGWVNSLGYTRSFGNPSATANLAFTLPNSSGTLALTDVAQTYSANGASSTAAITLTGTPFVGTGTTSVPLFYLNGGSAPTTWNSTASGGTYIGVNSIASFAGNFIDFHVNGGASLFKVSNTGAVTSLSSFTGTSFILNASNFIDVNVGLRLRGQAGGVEIAPNGSTVILATTSLITLSAALKYPAGSTGSGAALLGSNSPAGTLTAPYTWISAQASDGSTVYIPCWK